MKSKWHISIIILIITIFGVVCQQQITAPNQEIVLQLSNIEVNSQVAQETIAIVKKHLEDLGANNIHVKKEEGKLKISYYSEVEVASIKETLNKEDNLKLDYHSNQDKDKKNTSNNDLLGYNFDVYEIQDSNDVDLGLNGIILNKKSESDRFLDPNFIVSFYDLDNLKLGKVTKGSYLFWKKVESTIDKFSYKIPDVRAGPQTYGNS
ncbi:MAG TPA: hypothetical protein VKN14_00755 [Flavobacteriaceae bacterium]|nr:hypothetical protein [Flavobacteriaceae bacterium]